MPASRDVAPQLTARTDDANRWVTGRCWLYCRRRRLRVLWIGPVTSPSGHGALYACEDCIAELDAIVREESTRKDLARGDAPGVR